MVIGVKRAEYGGHRPRWGRPGSSSACGSRAWGVLRQSAPRSEVADDAGGGPGVDEARAVGLIGAAGDEAVEHVGGFAEGGAQGLGVGAADGDGTGGGGDDFLVIPDFLGEGGGVGGREAVSGESGVVELLLEELGLGDEFGIAVVGLLRWWWILPRGCGAGA